MRSDHRIVGCRDDFVHVHRTCNPASIRSRSCLALTGYRCVTDDGSTIVDTAHIEPWAYNQNDELTNGLALSKNAHWMFDEGLWSASDDLRVIVDTRRFQEHGPEFMRLNAIAGRHLQFDPAAKLRPSVEMFRRHRARHGFRVRV
ncbi:HNH endonuclease [Verrucomicrobiota bacterium sgz303538]